MRKITGVLVAIIAGTMFQAQAQTVMSSETQALLDQLRNLTPNFANGETDNREKF